MKIKPSSRPVATANIANGTIKMGLQTEKTGEVCASVEVTVGLKQATVEIADMGLVVLFVLRWV
jgi:hypothetical protein